MEPIRKFQHHDIVEIIQDLEYIRINLARIGKLSTLHPEDLEKVFLVQSLFLADVKVQKKFFHVWQVLVDNFKGGEEDDLDDQLDIIDHWNIPFHLKKEEIMDLWKEKGQMTMA